LPCAVVVDKLDGPAHETAESVLYGGKLLVFLKLIKQMKFKKKIKKSV